MNYPVNINGVDLTPEMMETINDWRTYNDLEESIKDLDRICEQILLNWDWIDDYLDVKSTLMLLSSLKNQLKIFVLPEKDSL